MTNDATATRSRFAKHRRKVIWGALAIPVLSLLWLRGCGPGGWWWTEDVQLSDGTVIKVRQARTYMAGGEWASPMTITIGGSLKVLQGPFPSEKYEWGPTPVLLDRDPSTNQLVMVVLVDNDFQLEGDSRPLPRPPYFQLRLTDKGWIQEPVARSMYGREANLLLNVSALRWRGEHVTVDEKLVLNPLAPTRRVARQIMPDAGIGDARGNSYAPLTKEQKERIP
jgi:hypothetical protein